MSFSQAHPALARALAARGYADPTAVQSAVAAPELAGADMLVSARTGSGKTVAFGMALAERLLGPAEIFAPAGKPLALVVAPTRELALQVARELAWLYGETGARLVSCVGGMDPRREQRQLAQGAHIVVGTPGRLCDHLDRGNLDLTEAVAVVLDEADEMLDLGFREDLEKLLGAAPADRQTLLFSATLPADIVRLARDFMRKDATRVDVAEDGEVHADIDYHAVRVFPHEIEKAVVNLLRFHDAATSIVFCGTREGVKRLTGALLERGFSVVALSGEMGQGERNEALSALRDGRARVCVATDVAARGLDVPDLGLVIHAGEGEADEAHLGGEAELLEGACHVEDATEHTDGESVRESVGVALDGERHVSLVVKDDVIHQRGAVMADGGGEQLGGRRPDATA